MDGGGGIANAGTFSLTLNNSIVFGNEASNFPATNDIVGAFTSNNSLVGVNPSFVAPLDASTTAPTIGGDYRLGNLSIAVDAGNNSLVPGGITVDLDGNPRRFNDTGVPDTGLGTAPIVDIGAYEKQTNSAALPVLSISDVSIAEGNSGTSILAFTVTRSGASASVVGFDFATADGTATVASGDYMVASGSGSAAGGAAGSTQVSVTINGDGVFEGTETFFVNLSAPSNATIGDGQGIGTLTNDDIAPTLAINNVNIAEGNSGTSSLVFTVTRTGLTAFPATFTALATDGTASAPSDYSATLAGTTSIAAGGVTATTTLTATINGDAVVGRTRPSRWCCLRPRTRRLPQVLVPARSPTTTSRVW
ncbi:MAG: hypothetical protein IPK97_10090 [Ahniella sp.]|nr:hypothetical protein [Ahniella sp.]